MWQRRLVKRPLNLLLALAFSPVTAVLADELQIVPGDLKPISRVELGAAVQKGEPIIGRTVEGQDIAAVLGTLASPDGECAARGRMEIDKSVVRGAIPIAAKLPSVSTESSRATLADDDAADSTEDASPTEPSQWLLVPLVIRDSVVNDRLSLDSVGFACEVDVSRSTFVDTVNFSTVTFVGDVKAEGAIFKAGIESFGAEFKSAAYFRHAKFMGNVEFVPKKDRKPIFQGDVDFREAVFNRRASFLGAQFLSHMDFRYAQFGNVASFGNSKLGAGPAHAHSGSFYMAEFAGLGGFRGTHFTSLRLWQAIFRAGADFHGARGRSLDLFGVAITGPVSFDDARIENLKFDGFGGSMVVDGEVVFRRARIGKLAFNRVAFKKAVDLQEASIRSELSFRTVSFDGDLRFEDGPLSWAQHSDDESHGDLDPDNVAGDVKPKIAIRDITLNGGLYINADQFLNQPPWWLFWREPAPNFDSNDPRIWRELKRAFEIAKNIELRNYAEYRLRLLEEARAGLATRMSSIASRWFWGLWPAAVARGWLVRNRAACVRLVILDAIGSRRGRPATSFSKSGQSEARAVIQRADRMGTEIRI
jgi:hypothetical protein